MKITVNGCVYRTENLPQELLEKPEFKKAIEKAKKREAELEALNNDPIPLFTKGEFIIPKKGYKNLDKD